MAVPASSNGSCLAFSETSGLLRDAIASGSEYDEARRLCQRQSREDATHAGPYWFREPLGSQRRPRRLFPPRRADFHRRLGLHPSTNAPPSRANLSVSAHPLLLAGGSRLTHGTRPRAQAAQTLPAPASQWLPAANRCAGENSTSIDEMSSTLRTAPDAMFSGDRALQRKAYWLFFAFRCFEPHCLPLPSGSADTRDLVIQSRPLVGPYAPIAAILAAMRCLPMPPSQVAHVSPVCLGPDPRFIVDVMVPA